MILKGMYLPNSMFAAPCAGSHLGGELLGLDGQFVGSEDERRGRGEGRQRRDDYYLSGQQGGALEELLH